MFEGLRDNTSGKFYTWPMWQVTPKAQVCWKYCVKPSGYVDNKCKKYINQSCVYSLVCSQDTLLSTCKHSQILKQLEIFWAPSMLNPRGSTIVDSILSSPGSPLWHVWLVSCFRLSLLECWLLSWSRGSECCGRWASSKQEHQEPWLAHVSAELISCFISIISFIPGRKLHYLSLS